MRWREVEQVSHRGETLLPKPIVESWGSDRAVDRQWLIKLGAEPNSSEASELLKRSKRAYGLPVTALERAAARNGASRK